MTRRRAVQTGDPNRPTRTADGPPIEVYLPTADPVLPVIPKPQPTVRTTREPREILLNESAAGHERDILLGHVLQGAKWIYINALGASGKYLYRVAAIGEGPIRSCRPRKNGDALTLASGSATNPQGARYESGSYVKVWVYDGSQADGTQETLSGLFALDENFITTGDAWNNLAFCVIREEFNLNNNSEYGDWTFDCEGYRDLYDPRDATRKYSENRSLWIRELATNTRWGGKVPEAKVDNDAFETAAEVCAIQVFADQPAAAPTVAAVVTAGNLTGDYYYKFANVNANGVPTLPSPASTQITGLSAQQADVTVPAGDAFTANQYVYRTSAGGSTLFRYIGTLAGGAGGVFRDNVSHGTWLTGVRAPTRQPHSVRRYEGGGRIISQRATLKDWLDTLAVSCMGYYAWPAGKLQLIIDDALPGGYTPVEYTDSGANLNVIAGSIRWGRKPRRDRANEIEVFYTDIANDFARANYLYPVGGAVGVIPVRATFYCDDIPDSTYAGRLARLMYNLSNDDAEFRFTTDRSGIETLRRDVVKLTGAGLTEQLVRIRSADGAGEGFRFYGTEYVAGSYSDEVELEDAPIEATASEVPAAYLDPPDVDVGTVTWTEETYEEQSGNWPSRAILDLDFPDSAYVEAVEVHVSINGGPLGFWFDMPSAPWQTPPLYETGTYDLTLKTRTFAKRLSTGVTVQVEVEGITAAPAEIVDVDTDISATTGLGAVWWNPPLERSSTLYADTFWNNFASLTSFTASRVNNAQTDAIAFATPAGTSRLGFDNGSVGKTFRQVDIYHTTGITGINGGFSVEWSTDNVAWNAVTSQAAPDRKDMGGGIFRDSRVWASGGSRRYWRVSFAAANSDIREVHFSEYGAEYDPIRGYRVYDVRSGNRILAVPEIPALARPTAAKPLAVDPFISFIPADWVTAASAIFELVITVVSSAGVESDGVVVTAAAAIAAHGGLSDYVPQTQNTMSLSNGLNSDWSPSAGPGAQYITGPTAAFSLGGFTGGAGGVFLPIYNSTAQPMTIVNEDMGSAAGNRIKTMTGGNIVLAGPCEVLLKYADTLARWVVVAVNDGASLLATSTGTGSVVRGTGPTISAPSMTAVNITDSSLSFNGAKWQSFLVWINNTAGTLQHKIISDVENAVLPTALVNKITGASATFANTPNVAVGVDFTSGAGVDNTGTSQFIFNTAAQTATKFAGMATIERNNTATSNLLVGVKVVSRNINGTTRIRLCLDFRTAADAAHAISTANIASGKFIIVRVWALLD